MTHSWHKTSSGWQYLKDEKWAVHNHNTETGEIVCVMETPQEAVARAISASAGEEFKRTKRPFISLASKL